MKSLPGRQRLSKKITIMNKTTLIALLCLTAQAVWAQQVNVNYVERSWNGSEVITEYKQVEATVLNYANNKIYPRTGFYVVTGDVSYDEIIIEKDQNVSIILNDGATLTAYIDIKDGNHNDPTGGTLNIYGQTADGNGKLVANAKENEYPGIRLYPNAKLNIHGGDIQATGAKEGAGIGGPWSKWVDELILS